MGIPVGLYAVLAMSSRLVGVLRAWRHCKVPDGTAEQWKHYVDLCGTWHGTWKRFAPGEKQSLRPQEQFQAVCAPCVAADGESVHHVNRYPPNVAPKPGRLADGLTEVDFGRYDKTNFLTPFGPHSRAAYGPGWAVMWPSAPQPERLAVELISKVGDQRQRLVAMWRGQGEDSPKLSMVTSIVESLDKKPFVQQLSGDGDINAEENWYPLHASAWAFLPWQLTGQDIQVGLAWQGKDDLHGIIADIAEGQLRSIQVSES